MRYLEPKRLRPGDRVALVAPASPFRTDELLSGLEVVRACGLRPVLGPNVRNLRSSDVHGAPLLQRAEELMWAFTDPSVSAVVTVLGGIGSGETLPYLDFGRIRESRRAVLGLSDITALNNGILAGAGLCSINGQYPSVRIDEGEFLHDADCESLRFTLELMMSDRPWGDRPFQLNRLMPRTVSPGRARGHAIGCNLETLCTLLGTPFMPEVDGAILFVEDTHKSGENVARQLGHLRLAGVLDRVAGIVVGEFIDVPTKMEDKVPAIEDVIEQYLSDGPPCSYGYSFSHGPTTIPIPIGADCEMDADTGAVTFGFAMG